MQAGFRIKGQDLSNLLQHSLLYGRFLLKLSQGRKEPLWCGCVTRLKEQSLLFLHSQICWEWPREWRTRQLFSCRWPRGREGDYRGGVGDTHGNGDYFFSSFPQELMAVLVYWRWKQDCMPQRALEQADTSQILSSSKAVKVIELNGCHQQESVPYTGVRVHPQSWHLGIY